MTRRDRKTDEIDDDLIDGLHAYDSGCVSSGIHDEVARAHVIEQLKAMDEETFRLWASRYIREHFLTEGALAQRYGIEDVKSFIEWLDEYMDYSL